MARYARPAVLVNGSFQPTATKNSRPYRIPVSQLMFAETSVAATVICTGAQRENVPPLTCNTYVPAGTDNRYVPLASLSAEATVCPSVETAVIRATTGLGAQGRSGVATGHVGPAVTTPPIAPRPAGDTVGCTVVGCTVVELLDADALPLDVCRFEVPQPIISTIETIAITPTRVEDWVDRFGPVHIIPVAPPFRGKAKHRVATMRESDRTPWCRPQPVSPFRRNPTAPTVGTRRNRCPDSRAGFGAAFNRFHREPDPTEFEWIGLASSRQHSDAGRPCVDDEQ